LKSGSLILVEPSGPVQACNGIALPLYIYIYMYNTTRLTIAIGLPGMRAKLLL